MPTLLHIDVSPRGDYSVSRNLAKTFVAEWKKSHSDGKVVTRDLQKTTLPFVDLPWIAGAYTPAEQHSSDMKQALEISDELIAELSAADHILLATPMYNFSIPAILKAYIDHIVRINKTFTANYEGLVKGKKMNVILASGGVYAAGTQMESYNVESAYIRQIFGFIGISDVTFQLAGGTSAIDMGKAKREDFIAPFEKEVAAAATAL